MIPDKICGKQEMKNHQISVAGPEGENRRATEFKEAKYKERQGLRLGFEIGLGLGQELDLGLKKELAFRLHKCPL